MGPEVRRRAGRAGRADAPHGSAFGHRLQAMKACIYGAGAIGGWIGVRLARAGAQVSVVARGATLDALQLPGLRLDEEGETVSVPVQSSSDPAELGVQDLVVIAVKAPAMAQVARAIGPLLG